jgi:hypothetical protein
MEFQFSEQIFEKFSRKNFMKIRPVVAEFFDAYGQEDRRVDRQTDGHDEANSRRSHFLNAPNECVNPDFWHTGIAGNTALPAFMLIGPSEE